MGCGSSGNVVAAAPEAADTKLANGRNGADHHNDDLPTVLLPDTPAKAKPPIAYEIPMEEFEGNRKPRTPPPHVQRLLQPPAQVRLPDIRERLAEAEQRRLMILQQRAASAQRKAQKMSKHLETEKIGLAPDERRVSGVLNIAPPPGACEGKNI